MNVQELSKQLKLLQDELACLRAAEQHVQEKIDSMLSELDKQLNAPPSDEEKHDITGLPTLLRKFEAEHPELTDSINRVMITLGNMGI